MNRPENKTLQDVIDYAKKYYLMDVRIRGNTISYALKYRKDKIAQKHNSYSVMGYTFNPCKSTFCNIPCN